jgi:hypothetical protein
MKLEHEPQPFQPQPLVSSHLAISPAFHGHSNRGFIPYTQLLATVAIFSSLGLRIPMLELHYRIEIDGAGSPFRLGHIKSPCIRHNALVAEEAATLTVNVARKSKLMLQGHDMSVRIIEEL